MLTGILAFFTAVPSIVGGITAFTNKYFDAKVSIAAARLGADKDVMRSAMVTAGIEAQASVNRLQVLASSKVLLAILVGFAFPWIVYEWKIVLYDNIWMNGQASTPLIKGLVAEWSGLILGGIFGTSSVMALTSMYFNKKG